MGGGFMNYDGSGVMGSSLRGVPEVYTRKIPKNVSRIFYECNSGFYINFRLFFINMCAGGL